MYQLRLKAHFIVVSLCLITCSTLPYGKITGELVGEKSESPISGGTIIPCWIENNVRATVVLGLATTVGSDGKFEITNLPPGRYILLYNTSERLMTTWDTLDGVSVPLSLESFLDVTRPLTEEGQPRGNLKSETYTSLKVLDGLEGGITLQTGSTFEYDNNGLLKGGAGSFLLKEYGFSVNYDEGKILSVKIPSRGMVDVSIKAWGL
ncbi:MAG: hypothetical protein HN521_03525 [Candidatus Latescibacteria bacterium]|jgi:hypothetical protein|nr:hypothetical protein [Candidatus Latescibacterota bacterium]